MSVVASVAINVDAANAIQQLNRVKTATGGTQTALAAATKGAQGFGAAIGAALGPILGITTALGAVGKAMNVFQERQADIAVLRNGLTGLVADVEGVSAGLQVMADEFGKVTLFSEEDFMQGAQMLTSFRDISVSSYQDVINTAGDVAQVMKTDVNSALLQLAKALQDPVLGLTALSRSGIQFSESQKETIKSMVEAGNAAGAQALILGELQTQYGGAAAAAGSAGFAGAMDTLAEVTNDALEVLGKALDPILGAGLNALSAGVQTLADWWSYLGSEVFPKVVDAAQPVIDALKGAFEDIDFDIIRVAIQSILIQGLEIAIGVIRDFSNLLAIVINGFKKLSQNPVFQFIAEQVGNLAGMLGLTNDKVGEFKQKQQEAGDAQKDAVANAVNLTKETDNAAASANKLKEEYKKTKQLITETAAANEALLTAQINYEKAVGNTISAHQLMYKLNEEILKNKLALIEVEEKRGTFDSKHAEVLRETAELEKLTADELLKQQEAQNNVKEAAENTLTVYQDIQATNKQTLTDLQSIASADQLRLQTAKARGDSAGEILNLERQIMENKKTQALVEATINGYTKENRSLASQIAKYTMDAKIEAAEYAYSMARAANSMREIVGMESAKAVGVKYDFGPAGQNEAFMAAYRNAMEEFRKDQAKSFVSVTMTEKKYAEINKRFFDAAQIYNKQYWETNRRNMEEAWFKGGGAVLPGMSTINRPVNTGMQQYGIGSNAAMGTPQVNITTGPVTQMGGTNYVTMSDLQQATSTAARQGANLALSQLQNNPSVRRTVGVAR